MSTTEVATSEPPVQLVSATRSWVDSAAGKVIPNDWDHGKAGPAQPVADPPDSTAPSAVVICTPETRSFGSPVAETETDVALPACSSAVSRMNDTLNPPV